MDENDLLWMKASLLWVKTVRKRYFFGVMDEKVILWMKRPKLWKKKIPA